HLASLTTRPIPPPLIPLPACREGPGEGKINSRGASANHAREVDPRASSVMNPRPFSNHVARPAMACAGDRNSIHGFSNKDKSNLNGRFVFFGPRVLLWHASPGRSMATDRRFQISHTVRKW